MLSTVVSCSLVSYTPHPQEALPNAFAILLWEYLLAMAVCDSAVVPSNEGMASLFLTIHIIPHLLYLVLLTQQKFLSIEVKFVELFVKGVSRGSAITARCHVD